MDRERGTEKLTSHWSAKIIHGNKQKRIWKQVEALVKDPCIRMQIMEMTEALSKTNYGFAYGHFISFFVFYPWSNQPKKYFDDGRKTWVRSR